MKTTYYVSLLLSFLLMACSEHKDPSTQINNAQIDLEVPEVSVAKTALRYKNDISLWTLNDLPYSGFAVTHYPDSSLKEKFGILNGKKQNKAIQWYPDGHFKNITHYHKGKLQGEKKTWSVESPHILLSHFNFQAGKAHGEQKKWYPTGELFKKLNMVEGKEEGIQQAFRKNGSLFANYEARGGRIFGLKKAALCYGLEDEKMNLPDSQQKKIASRD